MLMYVNVRILCFFNDIMLLYFMITTLFVGCKQGGRSKNVSNNFDPWAYFFPMGKAICILDPSYVKTVPRKIYI